MRKLKKFLSMILTVTIFILSMNGNKAFADFEIGETQFIEFQSANGMKYNLGFIILKDKCGKNTNSAEIVDYRCPLYKRADSRSADGQPLLVDVVIPEKVELCSMIGDGFGKFIKGNDKKTYTVSSIGLFAFYDKKSIRSVTLNKNIKSIEQKTFMGCRNLQEINFGQDCTLSSIGSFAFKETGLRHIDVPETVVTIEFSAFSCCKNLSDVRMCANLRHLGGCAFEECPIETIEIPFQVRHIRFATFRNCKNLKEVRYYNGVEEIQQMAFAECTSLRSFTVLENVKTIGSEAFKNCFNLEEFNFVENSGLSCIENFAFIGCGIRSLCLPNTTVKIECGAFAFCRNLSNVHLGNRLVVLGTGAFKECAIERIDIPEGIKFIDYDAFRNCRNLREVKIPSSLRGICKSAFWGCPVLRSDINIQKLILPGFILRMPVM